VVNRAADGSVVKLADPVGGVMEWTLRYSGLSDDEIAALESFFAEAEGTLNSFTFADPVANLLAWSGDFSNAVWTKGPQLTVSGQHIANTGAGAQSITQTLTAPPEYLYCLSAYVKAATPCTVTMLACGQRADRVAGTDWGRIVLAATGTPTFGLELPAGVAVDVLGMQVEAQGAASEYQESTTGGVHEGARLGQDELTVTTVEVGSHSCVVKVVHAEHL
jgi:hypothetical protein